MNQNVNEKQLRAALILTEKFMWKKNYQNDNWCNLFFVLRSIYSTYPEEPMWTPINKNVQFKGVLAWWSTRGLISSPFEYENCYPSLSNICHNVCSKLSQTLLIKFHWP